LPGRARDIVESMVVPAGRPSGPGTEEKGRLEKLINQLVDEEEKC